MTKKNKTGFFGKLLGGNKKESCCALQFEEVPETESKPTEETAVKQPEKKEKKSACCECGC